MMLTLPERGPKLRWVIILISVIIFLWLGIEDNHTWPVALLGGVAAGMIAIFWITGKWGGETLNRRQALVLGSVSGIVTGAGASLLSALLMLLKNARHAHFYPDFPPAQMGAMITRAPFWGLAGGLIGLGICLLWIGLHHKQDHAVYSTGDSAENESTT